jgi:hypothetical protein
LLFKYFNVVFEYPYLDEALLMDRERIIAVARPYNYDFYLLFPIRTNALTSLNGLELIDNSSMTIQINLDHKYISNYYDPSLDPYVY